MPLDQTGWNAPRSVSPEELRQRLDEAGYDVGAIERLGEDLRIDLLAILAGWVPTICEVFMLRSVPVVRGTTEPVPDMTAWASLLPPLPIERPRWWRRMWNWMRRRK